jgi:hypothetical protein|nr:hypothetical protein [Kofleriaceae bacterium]
MYRDDSNQVDEHDRAVGAVLIAEAILASCDAAVARIAAAATPPADRWHAVMALHDTYPDVWRSLDRARRELARRGANTTAFDEARPHAPRSALRELKSVADGSTIDRDALEAARGAIEMLKVGLPGADWTDIGARTEAVGATVLAKHGRPRLVVGLVAGVAAIAVMGGFVVAQPAPHVHRTPAEIAAAREEALSVSLAGIDAARKAEIAVLQASMAPVIACDAEKSHDLIRLLVLDGQNLDAKLFADEYDAKCGEDAFIESWAKAPTRPKHDAELQLVGYVHFHDGDHALVVDSTGATSVVDATPAAIPAQP